ncbi:MAG: hypothetical protein RLZ10_1007 [Bacteroidota bacterium]|jgi:hypothetical protein
MKTKLLFLFILILTKTFSQNSQFMGFVSPTVSYMTPAPNQWIEPKNQVIKPNFKGRELIEVDNTNTHLPDWVWQQHQPTEKIASATKLWDVQGLGSNMSPPDPSGEADSLYYIQATNSGGGAVYRIMNKATGATVGNTSYTMQSLGGSAGLGDPIVLYYKPARKWFLTEFSSSGNKLIVHVSQTSNPQGAYWTYSFTCTQFPDYPKWSFCQTSDALLVTTNEGGPPTTYAMKLSTLLTGGTSPFIKIAIGYSLNGFGFQSITPVDLEGDNPAPNGMKPLFVRHRDDESHSNGTPDSQTNDWIELWEMTINWTNNTATVAKIQDISIAEIDSKLCGLTSFACIKQPGTTNTLDPLRETVMYKAPMRIFDTHQALVLCLSTDVDGADRSGVRWIELRRNSGVTTATWVKHQEGTYAPGTGTSRWMPAINIDKWGNIIMAYSTSSNATGDFPSIKMTGRKPCDPLNTMTMTETTLIAGTTAKTGDTRWGDYHHMCIDDFDGETFYYTGVYSSSGTKTRNIAVRMNPDAMDATISSIFQVNPGNVCGSSTQLGVVIQNLGTTAITSGVIQWQVGAGALTNVNYTSNQLNSINSLDTVFINITGLINGANVVTVNSTTVNGTSPDENTCNDSKTFTVTVGGGGAITVSSTINTQPTCTSNIGQVTLSASGGSAPYTYSLNNGTPQSSATFSNLSAGTYSYTISDNIGCSSTGTFTLNLPTSIVTSASLIANISCNGQQNAVINVVGAGGQASYTYSIDGVNFQASSQFGNLGAGTYTVYAKDANGCIGQASISVTQPSAITINAVPTMISCFGANNGSISVNVTGGTSPYVNTINSSSGSFSGLSSGLYTVTSTDANGCTQTFSTTITEPTQVSISGVAVPATVGSNNGSITMTGSGGLTPYTYSINGTNYYSGSLFSNLAAGTYTCYIKDANGCIGTTIITVDEQAGLSENQFEIIQLYPNPNNGIFELEVDGIMGDKLECKLFNIQGQIVSEFQLTVVNGSVKKTIEMSRKLAAGTYYLGLYNQGQAFIKQFVKE